MPTQYLVAAPLVKLFTDPKQFKSIFFGSIYVGNVDEDPLNPSHQQQVYVVDESNVKTPVNQPIVIGSGGYAEYNGIPAKFVCDAPYSIVVKDKTGAEKWRIPDIRDIDIFQVKHNDLEGRNPGDKSCHNSDDIDFSKNGLDVGGGLNTDGPINLVSSKTNSVDPMVNVNRMVDNSIPGNGHCFSDSSTLNRSGGVAYACYDARIIVDGSDSYDHIAPFQNGVQYKTTGTILNAYGYIDSIIVTDTHIGERTGVKVLEATLQGDASIGTNIGVRIAGLSAGKQNFSIYTDGTTPSYFGGKVTGFQGLQTSGAITIDAAKKSRFDVSGSSGLRVEANSGTQHDFSIMTNGYSDYIMTTPKDTVDMKFWGSVAFNGANPLPIQTVAGSISGNAGLKSLLIVLEKMGLIIDQTT